MPKRTDIHSILMMGSGPITIGQACEFDYSGTQACNALREEGYRVILVNSNPATIMTDPDKADAVYIEPVEWRTVAQIIAKERPDALLPTMGGQTALNCALDLNREGILAKYQVEMIGASQESIDMAEDRGQFRKAMSDIGLKTPNSAIARDMESAWQALPELGLPIIIRPSFTMGGSGGGIAYNKKEFAQISSRGLDVSPTTEILLEQSVLGWKEYEMEVVRDSQDNCIIVCAIENFDPMGVHTGDSITVAPAQTLTDKEYQILRNAALAVLRKIGVDTGGSNVQFAVNPGDGELMVIEMNPRVSRSSALASKATGFPIAKVAAKLAVGLTLDEIRNDITGGVIPASFEPSIDYVVTKIPRFTFEKFPDASNRLTTQMKSVGEVMGIGRHFQESLQKALRGLETGLTGLDEVSDVDKDNPARLLQRLSLPTEQRLLYIAQAFRAGQSLETIHSKTHIDPWFLSQIEDLVHTEETIRGQSLSGLSADTLRQVKRKGFSDARLAQLLDCQEADIRDRRFAQQIHPVYKRVDSCAAEFPATSAYLYSSYDEECEARASRRDKILILGSGPNRIGQGIEFDYCCVHAALACREAGFEAIMINCNPETVSTDYDVSDRLYFEPLTLEDVLEVIHLESPSGVIVQYGGQTSLKLAHALEAAGATVIGTTVNSIDLAEDRKRFQKLLNDVGLRQPPNRMAKASDDYLALANEVGYPLVVRPSYVLGGRAMETVHNDQELSCYMQRIAGVARNAPVLLDHFLDQAIEVDVDAVSDGQQVMVAGIMQHIEQAGVHSGDSACSLPPYSLSDFAIAQIHQQTQTITKQLQVCGLINIQFAVQGEDIYILEANPRASRTVPFVSKASGIPLAKVGVRCILGKTLKEQNVHFTVSDKMYAVKEAVFPFTKFPDVDPILGPEMKSTGEVMGMASDFGKAYAKSQLGAGNCLPTSGKVLLSVRNADKPALPDIAQQLIDLGFCLVATQGTAHTLHAAGITCEIINKVQEGQPHVVDMIKNDEVSLIINTTEGSQAIADSFEIRREALQRRIYYTTTLGGGYAACMAIQYQGEITVHCLQDIHRDMI